MWYPFSIFEGGYMKFVSILALILLSYGAATAQQPTVAHCILTNITYAGRCHVYVDIAPDDNAVNACTEVFSYLNDHSSSGKNYCQNTAIRGNWELLFVEGIAVQ
jgi:hypothetical protein